MLSIIGRTGVGGTRVDLLEPVESSAGNESGAAGSDDGMSYWPRGLAFGKEFTRQGPFENERAFKGYRNKAPYKSRVNLKDSARAGITAARQIAPTKGKLGKEETLRTVERLPHRFGCNGHLETSNLWW